MLPRAALRHIRSSRLLRQHNLCGVGSATTGILPSRTFASSSSKPPKSSAPSSSIKATRPPPPPKPFVPSSRTAQQTSPGTRLSKNETWKPKDGVKLASSAGGSISGAQQVTGAASPVEGGRPADESIERRSPLDAAANEEEPVAQTMDSDRPVSGSIRDSAHENLAASENTLPPPDLSVGREQSRTRLPDLRQGIPSTFDVEFGSPKQQHSRPEGAAAQTQEDKLDLTTPPTEGRERQEREYDRTAYETSIDRKRQQLANYLFASIFLAACLGGFYLARPFSKSEELPAGLQVDYATGWSPGKLYARMRARFGSQLGYYTEPFDTKLLPDIPESQRAPYTLVIGLEDLLIHTTWDTKHGYRVAKRPGVDYFIRYLSQYYELVLFTSSPKAIADPVIAKLDPYHFMWPLGREATKFDKGEIVKDLSYLNRPLAKTLIIDTLEHHVRNQPENAVILSTWNGDPKDAHAKDLVALIPFLEYVATMGTDDVRTVIKSFEGKSIPEEFARREAEARKRFQEQLAAERARKPRFSLGSVASSLGVRGGASMGGGMVLADGQSVAEGLAQGKMLSDQIREQGQRQYEHIEKQIRESGEQWLKDEAEEIKRSTESHMKEMKQNTFSWFSGSGSKTA